MAVSEAGLSEEDFFTSLGMLIIQGRKWDAFRRTRGRGLHCPTVRNSSPPHHHCSPNNVECQTALSFRNAIQRIWRSGGTVIIKVLLLPECGHAEPTMLLERWTLSHTTEVTTMPQLSLMQAIDSMIHFSQLCSWWSSTNGAQPSSIQYKVHKENDPEVPFLCFREKPSQHRFMVSHGVNVRLESLPRQTSRPELYCENCFLTTQQMEVDSPSRGRNFTHRQATSRHSSASSDSLSPSMRRIDHSPYGSPRLSSFFRTTVSSSSSSRTSSRTASPCASRSPSEKSSVIDLESHQEEEFEFHLDQRNNRSDSGFVDNTSRENPTINQDEELANQLDSLSDSDLSDDYVIDGPVGSPGLVGTPIASPDDRRVQMLQSTFAGFHCRHPTFNRLMGDAAGTGNRTRHSSLDSAVSNLERLDLEARRRLSRTNSDGQEFESLRGSCVQNLVENDFLLKDRKKRHGLQEFEMDFAADNSINCTSNNTFYASFQTESRTAWHEDAGSSEIFNQNDSAEGFNFNFKLLPPVLNSTPTTVGFVTMPLRPESLFLGPFNRFITNNSSQNSDHCEAPFPTPKKCPALKKILQDESKYTLTRSASVGDIKSSGAISRLPTVSVVSEVSSGVKPHSVMMEQPEVFSPAKQPCLCPQLRRDASPTATSRNLNIACESSESNRKEPQDLDSDNNVPSSSTLLRSPPSKLRILPSHCVEKNYLCNPTRQTIHKLSAAAQCGPIRKIQFNQNSEKPIVTSPAPIRRNNAVRFEFDEDMPKLNQRSSRSICRGKCMKKHGIVAHSHTHLPPTHRLLGSFEESIIHNRLEVLGSVHGFHAQLGASGSFCPAKVKLPVAVRFFHVSDDNAPSPYMGTMSLKGKECGKRGYHIPRKGTIQLTLFNPNNSVVKVFVVLYDVDDMPPGHRTFLRHRIFSKPTASTEIGVDQSEKQAWKENDHNQNRPNAKYLRYFVNLWLESSKTSKVYIHGDVKILFSLAANEWDSGNTFELEAQTEFPQKPRYSSKR